MPKTTNTTRYARYKSYAKDAVYHIYNRGNGKQNIFLDENDYHFYMNRLKRYLKKHSVSLICYALMPNHIHLAVQQQTVTPIFKFISSLHTSYSIYFNKKQNHVGHLFQDRFKQVIVLSDEQLLHLTRYIHLNPVMAGLVKSPHEYSWSSYREYIGVSFSGLCQNEIVKNLLTQNVELFPQKYAEFCNAPLLKKDLEMLEEVVPETF